MMPGAEGLAGVYDDTKAVFAFCPPPGRHDQKAAAYRQGLEASLPHCRPPRVNDLTHLGGCTIHRDASHYGLDSPSARGRQPPEIREDSHGLFPAIRPRRPDFLKLAAQRAIGDEDSRRVVGDRGGYVERRADVSWLAVV